MAVTTSSRGMFGRFLTNPAPLDKFIALGAGGLFGVIVNDVVESVQGGVWSTTLFSFPTPSGQTVGVGLDDVVQTLGGFLIAAALPGNPYIGYGFVAGTLLTKIGEIFGTKIKIFGGMARPQQFSQAFPSVGNSSFAIAKEGGISSSQINFDNQYLNNTLPYGAQGQAIGIPVGIAVNNDRTYPILGNFANAG